MHTALCKTDEQQDLLCSAGNCMQYLIIICHGEETEKEHACIFICVYNTESLCCIDMCDEINYNKKNQVIKILKCADINIKSFGGKLFYFKNKNPIDVTEYKPDISYG